MTTPFNKNFLPTPIISPVVTKELHLKTNVKKGTYCVNQATKNNQTF